MAATTRDLPRPSGRYLEKALGARGHSVRLRHGGTFRVSLDGDWLPVQGEQYFAANPLSSGVAASAWRQACGLRGAIGPSLVSDTCTCFAAWSLTIANSTGPELDQAAMLRLLGEMTWFRRHSSMNDT